MCIYLVNLCFQICLEGQNDRNGQGGWPNSVWLRDLNSEVWLYSNVENTSALSRRDSLLQNVFVGCTQESKNICEMMTYIHQFSYQGCGESMQKGCDLVVESNSGHFCCKATVLITMLWEKQHVAVFQISFLPRDNQKFAVLTRQTSSQFKTDQIWQASWEGTAHDISRRRPKLHKARSVTEIISTTVKYSIYTKKPM